MNTSLPSREFSCFHNRNSESPNDLDGFGNSLENFPYSKIQLNNNINQEEEKDFIAVDADKM